MCCFYVWKNIKSPETTSRSHMKKYLYHRNLIIIKVKPCNTAWPKGQPISKNAGNSVLKLNTQP